MLVLGRKRNETIMIGDCVSIKILEILADKVRIGIDAPPELSVHRLEVYESIMRSTAAVYAAERETMVQVLMAELQKNRDPAIVPGLTRAIQLAQAKQLGAGGLMQAREQDCRVTHGSVPPAPNFD